MVVGLVVCGFIGSRVGGIDPLHPTTAAGGLSRIGRLDMIAFTIAGAVAGFVGGCVAAIHTDPYDRHYHHYDYSIFPFLYDIGVGFYRGFAISVVLAGLLVVGLVGAFGAFGGIGGIGGLFCGLIVGSIFER